MSAEIRTGWQLEAPQRLETVHGVFALQRAREVASGGRAWLLTRGEVRTREPLLARVHSACVTSETFGGCDCDCAQQLDAALCRIAAAGRGALFYLFQEGRGAGFLAKARDRMLVQASGHRLTTFDAYARMGLGADDRSYAAVASIAGWAGIDAPLRLLTNNPHKLATLERDGVRVAGAECLEHAASPFNLHYVAAKRRSGHRLDADQHTGEVARLPQRVDELVPEAVPHAPQLLEVARYLLPVRVRGRVPDAPLWLWLHAYLDRDGGADRVVFTYGDPTAIGTPVRVQAESLLERLGLPRAPNARAWRRTLEEFAAAGSGAAAFLPADVPGGPVAPADAPSAETDAATRALLVHHTSTPA